MGQESIILESYSITTATWFPLEETIIGTISTQSTLVTGIGTTFTTQTDENDWLVNKNGNEARRILRIYSDTQLEIETPFTGDPLPGATVVLVKDKTMRYLKVDFISNAGTVKGATQATGGNWSSSKPWESPSFNAFLSPQLVTPGAGGANVIFGV